MASWTTIDPIHAGNNWYAYCENDPVNRVDLWGLEVDQYTNQVVLSIGPIKIETPYNHTFLIATPDNQSDFTDTFTDENIKSRKVINVGTQENPQYGIIFRAGPGKEGKLDNTVNLEKDKPELATTKNVIKAPDGMTDTEFIKSLIDADKNYTNNLKADKDSIPNYPELGFTSIGNKGNYYNSNSYISGLLLSIGAKPITPSSQSFVIKLGTDVNDDAYKKIIGFDPALYNKPVPSEYFSKIKNK